MESVNQLWMATGLDSWGARQIGWSVTGESRAIAVIGAVTEIKTVAWHDELGTVEETKAKLRSLGLDEGRVEQAFKTICRQLAIGIEK